MFICLHVVCDPETSPGPLQKKFPTPELEQRPSGGKVTGLSGRGGEEGAARVE